MRKISSSSALRSAVEHALELAKASRQRVLEWLAQWALATLNGLTGTSDACRRHLAEAERLAEELDSPVFRVWTAEIAIELASAWALLDDSAGDVDRVVMTDPDRNEFCVARPA